MSDVQARIEVLRPKPGDTIVLTIDGRLTKQQHDRVVELLASKIPAGVPVLVLDSSTSMAHIVSPHPPPELHPADVMGFDAWMRERTECAHREYMERISRRLPCDWATEDIARYFRVPLESIE
jgi:hypothetical protein